MLALTEWAFQLVDPTLAAVEASIDDDAGVCNVLTAGSPVEATIYSDINGTAASNPLTFTDGWIRFWTAASVTSVDLSLLTATGRAVFAKGVVPSQHRIFIDKLRREQLLIIPFAANDNSEQTTGFALPAGCRIDPYQLGLRVVTTDSGETIDVGLGEVAPAETGGDANGFITLASVGTGGYVNLIPQITGGTNIDYVSTNYVGALLATSIAGADAVATVGGWTPKMNYVTDGVAKTITYTGSAGSDTAAGYIIIGYTLMMVQ